MFATEAGLPMAITSMLDRASGLEPRQWVMEHMSCQRSTEILRSVVDNGSPESPRLAVKVNGLHGMHYWYPEDERRFEADYAFLASSVRRAG